MADEKKVTGKEMVEIEYLAVDGLKDLGIKAGTVESVHENIADKLIAKKFAKKVDKKEAKK